MTNNECKDHTKQHFNTVFGVLQIFYSPHKFVRSNCLQHLELLHSARTFPYHQVESLYNMQTFGLGFFANSQYANTNTSKTHFCTSSNSYQTSKLLLDHATRPPSYKSLKQLANTFWFIYQPTQASNKTKQPDLELAEYTPASNEVLLATYQGWH